MKKPWSISTTVRNPERLRGFLNVLKSLEGQPFNTENQVRFQILLIQNKLYKPNNLNREQEDYFNNIGKNMPYVVAREIFYQQDYTDPAMRGRTSVAPLKKMGFCITNNPETGIQITSLGRYLLLEDYDLGNIFFNHFIKWQLPNPASRDFTEREGFNIKPFIGTLHLINEVNKRWVGEGNKAVGISKEEFSQFIPTLIDHNEIENQAIKVINYRNELLLINGDENKRKFKENYRIKFAKEFLGTNNNSDILKLINNLKDYGDNAIRYFRLTRYLFIRGGGFYVDIEPRRSIEIEKLLTTDDASPRIFENENKYLEYLADYDQPILPWETKEEFEKICNKLEQEILAFTLDLKEKQIEVPIFSFREFKDLNKDQLKSYVQELRGFRRKLQELETHYESQAVKNIEKYIEELKSINDSKNRRSVELERLATLALNALNDALEIKPNYPVGDDNEPTFTAPSNKPDIECYYEKFSSICEVTMLTDRSQWYSEGQPVMRHLRDFENNNPEKNVYCLFIAPRLHRDTVNTFWNAVKYEYEGEKQRIVPITISQLIKLLETLLEIKKQGKKFTHNKLLTLYEEIVGMIMKIDRSKDWIVQIPKKIFIWQSNLLNNPRNGS